MENSDGAVTTTEPSVLQTWEALGLAPPLLEAIQAANYREPTDIQRELIPPALAGRDCLGQAKTGTGKTAAFTIPVLQLLTPGQPQQALVLVPTRELAAQVDEHVRMLAHGQPVKTALVFGGRSVKQQTTRLKQKPEIVVGTPGRVLDLAGRRELNLAQLRFVVLDEVDRMLDIGFRDDIRRILKSIKSEHQTIFVSATIDEEIRRLARTYARDPVELNVSRDELTVESVDQGFISVHPRDKFETLVRFLAHERPKLAIVFTNTKAAARRVAERLRKAGVNCKEIHGDLMQSRRERVMKSFRESEIQVLVATDLASRGLDVMEVSHIINYDVPVDASVYVHRIGRTARMGQRGYAVTFIGPEDGEFLTEIEKLINKELRRVDAPWIVQYHSPKRAAAEPATPAEPGAEAEAAAADAAPPKREDGHHTPQRFLESLRRCQVLDSYGLRPVARTLGSRFRTQRRRR